MKTLKRIYENFIKRQFVRILPAQLIRNLYKQVAVSNVVVENRIVKKGKLKYRLIVISDKIGNKLCKLSQFKIDRHGNVKPVNYQIKS